jgi:DNA-binding transcriptional regulator YdaS (Cro superfamily)
MDTIDAATRGQLAKELGLDPGYLYQLLTGRREMHPQAAAELERESCGRIRRWHVRSRTWHLVWPELVGALGAPAAPADAQAEVEVRDAA